MLAGVEGDTLSATETVTDSPNGRCATLVKWTITLREPATLEFSFEYNDVSGEAILTTGSG